MIKKYTDCIAHYDLLIDENNDPVHDPESLKQYMDKWDGAPFINELKLTKEKAVLEIGIGTGRLAVRTSPLCREFYGIDISPKTAKRARENLCNSGNSTIICGDFLSYDFSRCFDIIYSSLTFMHIKDKEKAFTKVFELLEDKGRFVLSIDKNPSDLMDMGSRTIKIYPDDPKETKKMLCHTGFKIEKEFETEFACIFVVIKKATK